MNKRHAGGVNSAMTNLNRLIDIEAMREALITPEEAARLTSLCSIDTHPAWPLHERYIASTWHSGTRYSGRGPTILKAVIAAHAARAARAAEGDA